MAPMSPLTFGTAVVAGLLAGAFAAGLATLAVVTAHERRALLRRAAGADWRSARERPLTARSDDSVVDVLAGLLPDAVRGEAEQGALLLRAGVDRPGAVARLALWRVGLGLSIVAIVALLARDASGAVRVALALSMGAAAFEAPRWWLRRRIQWRQDRIRRGVPDALDLLVVSVEAGSGLNGALQRVARELGPLHPELANELRGITRRIAAGQPRSQALLAPYERTGVEELRGLASHIAQSERWGTSIATVLRIYAQQMRDARRTAAERRAATATTRMLLPLALCVFPTIFVVLLGPAMLRLATMFGEWR
jgi:tight adherence protein C